MIGMRTRTSEDFGCPKKVGTSKDEHDENVVWPYACKSFEDTAGHLMKAKDYGNCLTNKNIKSGINLKSGSV